MDKIKYFILVMILGQSLVFAASLEDAAIAGDVSKVQSLLATKADPNASDNDGMTPLLWAASKGPLAVVKELLKPETKVNVNAKNRVGWTALMFAASRGYTVIVQELLKANADVTAETRLKWTALMWAKKDNRSDVIRAIRQWSIENQKRITNPKDIKILDGDDPGSYNRDFDSFLGEKKAEAPSTSSPVVIHAGVEAGHTASRVPQTLAKFTCPSPEELMADFQKYRWAIPPVIYSFRKNGVLFRMINPPSTITSLDSVTVGYDLNDKGIKSIICNYTGEEWFEQSTGACVSFEESNIEPKQISFPESLSSADKSGSNEEGNAYLWKKNMEFTINPK